LLEARRLAKEMLTPWCLSGFGDFHKKNQQFLVALPTP